MGLVLIPGSGFGLSFLSFSVGIFSVFLQFNDKINISKSQLVRVTLGKQGGFFSHTREPVSSISTAPSGVSMGLFPEQRLVTKPREPGSRLNLLQHHQEVVKKLQK